MTWVNSFSGYLIVKCWVMLSLVLLVMVVVGYSTLVTPAAPARSPRRDGGLDLPRAVPMPPPAAPHGVRAGQVAVTREPRQLWKTWRGSEHWMVVTVIISWPPRDEKEEGL